MNTQAFIQLDNVLIANAAGQFVINRNTTVDYPGVVQFVTNARIKGMNDLNIAKAIEVLHADVKHTVAILMKGKAVGAVAPAASSLLPEQISYSTRLRA